MLCAFHAGRSLTQRSMLVEERSGWPPVVARQSHLRRDLHKIKHADSCGGGGTGVGVWKSPAVDDSVKQLSTTAVVDSSMVHAAENSSSFRGVGCSEKR
jgi:hypothetical protein